MADIVGAVDRLRLAAQHQLVDQRGLRRAGGALAGSRLKWRGRITWPLASVRPGMPRLVEEIAQRRRASPGRARHGRGTCRAGAASRSVSAAATLAAIMNSSISRWLSRRGRGSIASMRPVGVEHDCALGQVEVERAALAPRLVERAIGAVERPQHRLEQRRASCRRAGRRSPPAPAS